MFAMPTRSLQDARGWSLHSRKHEDIELLEEDWETPRPHEPLAASTQEAAGMLEACITTGSTLTNVVQVTSGKLVRGVTPLKRNQSFCPTVNLGKLWTLVSEQTRVSAAKDKTGAAPTLRMLDQATTEFWGRGRGSFVKARFFRSAEEKIRGVGGACV
uniref:Large ribosomal subunit protein uL15 n=1 Tax=Rattus norvegicus TaxID=10116 RepID=A0ABK0LBT9_RAT